MDRLSKLRKVVLWTAGVVLVLLGAVLLALQTEAARGFVLDQLTEQLNQKLAGEVEVESVSGTLLWGATLHDFELRDDRGNPVLQADEVDANYSLGALLGGDLVFEGVGLEAPELTVRRYGDGELNLASITEPEAAPAEPAAEGPERDRLTIDRFDISNGTIHYEEKTVTGVDASGSLRLSTLGAVQASLDEVALETAAGIFDKPVPVTAEDVRVESSNRRFQVTAEKIDVSEDSGVEGLEFVRVEAAEGDADALSGSVEKLQVTPKLARLWSPELDLVAPIEVHAEASGTIERLDVTAVAKASENRRVQLDGNIEPSPLVFDLAVDAEDFDSSEWIATDRPVRFDVDANVAGRRADSGAIRYDAVGTADSLTYEQHTVEKAEFDLAGVLEPAPQTAEHAVARFTAKGTADLRGYRGRDLHMKRLDTRVDLLHTPGENTGDVLADLDGLVVSERTYGSGRIDLDLKPDGTFRLDVRAVPDILPDLPFFVHTSGKHSEEFEEFVVSTLELGRPGLTWSLKDRATVRVDDDAITIDSLVLHGPGSPIRLDGQYPVEGFIATIIQKIGRAGLDELLRSNRLPEKLREQLPERIEEAIPDEVEEKVTDEIRKRIRLPEF